VLALGKPKAVLVVLIAVILLCAVIGLYSLSKPMKIKSIVENTSGFGFYDNKIIYLGGENKIIYVEGLYGRALNFVQQPNAPFFSFIVENHGMRFKVVGCYSQTFADFYVDWQAEPAVRISGKVEDNVISAWSVDVETAGQMRNWYRFLPRSERLVLVVLSSYVGKRVWISGFLDENDLLSSIGIKTENGEYFKIPEDIFGKKAYLWGIFRRETEGMGFYIELWEMFVEQYVRIYP